MFIFDLIQTYFELGWYGQFDRVQTHRIVNERSQHDGDQYGKVAEYFAYFRWQKWLVAKSFQSHAHNEREKEEQHGKVERDLLLGIFQLFL